MTVSGVGRLLLSAATRRRRCNDNLRLPLPPATKNLARRHGSRVAATSHGGSSDGWSPACRARCASSWCGGGSRCSAAADPAAAAAACVGRAASAADAAQGWCWCRRCAAKARATAAGSGGCAMA